MNDATPTCGWNEAAPSFPGKDCQCEAYSESECGCDADWTSSEVHKLRKERDEAREAEQNWRITASSLRSECENLHEIIRGEYPETIADALIRQAKEAVK